MTIRVQITEDVKFALGIIEAKSKREGRPLRTAEARWVVIATFRRVRGISVGEATALTDRVLRLIAMVQETTR